jgi:hypothetical protein
MSQSAMEQQVGRGTRLLGTRAGAHGSSGLLTNSAVTLDAPEC